LKKSLYKNVVLTQPATPIQRKYDEYDGNSNYKQKLLAQGE
jgi:hypothetical protein